jgi:hypothetical protein
MSVVGDPLREEKIDEYAFEKAWTLRSLWSQIDMGLNYNSATYGQCHIMSLSLFPPVLLHPVQNFLMFCTQNSIQRPITIT